MAPDARPDRIILAGPRHGIEVQGIGGGEPGDPAPFLFELIPQWPVLASQEINSDTQAEAIAVQKDGGHWRISSPHMALAEHDLDDGYMLANALIGALIAAYVAQDDALVSIHAGAVRIGDGLILLLGDNESGKSTFATVLAAHGQRFFADDRLILNLADAPPVGSSLAIAPKLRLPLPQEASEAYRDFVARNSVLNWPEMAVLRPGPEQAAAFGESLPVRALVVLHRDDNVREPVLSTMRQPAMVRVLLEQLFAPHLTQQGELSACVRLAQSAEIHQLRYASAFTAADTLIAHFSAGAAQ
jgi:hypothetical protein